MKLNNNTQAKNFENRLKYAIHAIRNSIDMNYTKDELICVLEQLYTDFKAFYKQDKIIKVQIIQGYKDYGKAEPNIWKGVDNNVLIEVWHKNGYQTKEIKKEAINNFLRILLNYKIGEEITCYRIAKDLGYGQTEDEAWINLWGNRLTEYFPKYYFVCLFLDKIQVIDYLKDGKIIRKI
jgi:hypothetical protein